MERLSSPLNNILVQALELSARERLQLIERIAASVEGELPKARATEEEHWGKSLNKFIKTLDLSEWKEIDDPEVWLREQREKAYEQRLSEGDVSE
jgi:hypothetical protein